MIFQIDVMKSLIAHETGKVFECIFQTITHYARNLNTNKGKYK